MSSNSVRSIGRIIYIEPTDIPSQGIQFSDGSNFTGIDSDGYRASNESDIAYKKFKGGNTTFPLEDLNYTVDLQVVVPNINDLVGNKDKNVEHWVETTIEKSEKMATFFGGTKIGEQNSLTTNYTNASYREINSNGNVGNSELIGIDSIDINFDSQFYPLVTMRFTDVRAMSMMAPAEYSYYTKGENSGDKQNVYNNLFKSFFHFPYPQFFLTLKGYYGTKMTYMLTVKDFKTELKAETGNFEAVVSFIGTKYGFYTDIPMSYLIVAPYIGGVNDAADADGNIQKVNTNTYWNERKKNGVFTYDDGNEMLTFIEFLSEYLNAADKISKLEDTDLSKYFEGAQQYRQQINDLKGIETAFKNVVGAIRSISNVRTAKDGGVIFDANISQSTIISSIFEKFATSLLKYNNDETHKDEKLSYPIWTEKELQNKLSGLTKEDVVVKYHAITDIKNIVKYQYKEDYYDILTQEIKTEFYFVIEDYKKFLQSISEKIEKLEGKINEQLEKANERSAEISADIIGFKPNLENVFRMIFAHLDTFIHMFNNSCVIDKNRKVEDAGISADKTDRKDCGFLAPYFAYYQKSSDNKREAVYPGKITDVLNNLRNFPEVNFVEALCKAAIGCKEDTDKIFAQYNETQQTATENTGTETNSEDKTTVDYEVSGDYCFNGNFTATSIADIYHNANPYSVFSEEIKKLNYPAMVAYIGYAIYTRALVASFFGVDVNNEEFINKEVTNFKAANPKLPIDLINLLSKSNEVGGEKINRLVSYMGNTNFLHDYKNIMIAKWLPVGNTSIDRFTGETNDTKEIPLIYDKFLGLSHVKKSVPNDKHYKSVDFINPNNKITDYVSDINLNESNVIDFNNLGEKSARLHGKTSVERNYNVAASELFKSERPKLVTTFNSVGDYTSFVKQAREHRDDVFYPILECYQISQDSRGNWSKSFLDIFKEFENEETFRQDAKYLRGILILSALINTKIDKSFLDKNCIGKIPKMIALYLGAIAYFSEEEQIKVYGGHYSIHVKDNNDNVYLTLNGNKKDGSHTFLNHYTSKHDKEDIPFITMEHEKINLIDIKEYSGGFEFYNYFVEWCNSDEFNRLIEFGKHDTEKNAGNFKILSDEAQKILVDLYLDTVDIIVFNSNENGLKKYYNYNATTSWGQTYNNFQLDYVLHSNSFWDILGNCLTNVYSKEEDVIDTSIDIESQVDDESMKLQREAKHSAYYSLASLYNKWALFLSSSEDFELQSYNDVRENKRQRYTLNRKVTNEKGREFNSFLFVDSYMNDISQNFFINAETLFLAIKSAVEGETNYSVFSFITDLAQKNKLLFLSLPTYNNWYDAKTMESIFTPNFTTTNKELDSNQLGNTYILMYTNEDSHFLDCRDDETNMFANDGFDIADTWGNQIPEDTQGLFELMTGDNINICVPAFGVSYGKQNQSFFKNITINMDNPKQTDVSLANQFQLAQSGSHGDANYPRAIGQDIYSIYSNRSYTCTVEMLGCMNIMPMMYFQLNHIPMFKGAYMIISVSHSIRAGEFITKFTGVRVSKNQIPRNKKVIDLTSLKDRSMMPSNKGINLIKESIIAEISEEDFNNIMGDSYSKDGLNIVRYPDNWGEKNKNNNSIIADEKNELQYGKSILNKDITFNVMNAVNAMRSVVDKSVFGKNDKIPNNFIPIQNVIKIINNKKQRAVTGMCSSFVLYYVAKGFELNERVHGYNGAYCYPYLLNNGFDIVKRGTKTDVDKWVKEKAQAGDIVLMEHGELNKETNTYTMSYGHIAMYDGKQWVSDFPQNNMWVYKDGNPVTDIVVMRYKGTRIMPKES